MAALSHSIDPTLAALDALHSQAFSDDKPRPYLGASAIGNPCNRALWYGFRHATTRIIPASGYRAIQDGHRGEALMIEWLRSLPGIQLWTEDPEQPGKQIGFIDLHGHFRGNLDGIIQGLYQAPQTPHVWEHKVCNETKFRKLIKLIQTVGEKNALSEWDEIYFSQSQIYMHEMELTRHYLTVATPGNRAIVSCRTAYQPKVAKAILAKAESIITADRPPLKLRDDPSYYLCKFCDHSALCHGNAIPNVNCRTCAHSTARLDSAAPWTCELGKPAISGTQRDCEFHAFHPDLLANHAEVTGANGETGGLHYRMKADPVCTFTNGYGAVSSQSMWEKAQKGKSQPAAEPPIEADVLNALADEMGADPQTLAAGMLEEPDFERMTQAVKRLSAAWEGDEPRKQRLAALIEQIDSAFMGLAGRVQMQMGVAT